MASNIMNYSKGILEDAGAILYDLKENNGRLTKSFYQKWYDMLYNQSGAYVKDTINVAVIAVGAKRPYTTSVASDAQLASLVSQLVKRNESLIAAIKEQRAANAAAKEGQKTMENQPLTDELKASLQTTLDAWEVEQIARGNIRPGVGASPAMPEPEDLDDEGNLIKK